MEASVVIACRNSAEFLDQTLEGLAAQEWDCPWEIVLADNGSTDSSVAIFKEFALRHPELRMRTIDASERAGKSYAMNVGVLAAASRAILVCDSDDVPAPGWLRAMGEALRTHDFVAAKMEMQRLNDGPMGCYRSVPGDGLYQLPYAPYCFSVAGAVMGFTKRLYAEIGGFNTDFRIEDDEFCVRAHLKGYSIYPVPDAVVHYRLRQDPAAIFTQARQYGESDVLLAKKYRAYGPRQLGSWRGLLKEARQVARQYYNLRVRRTSPDAVAQARLQFDLGALAGQIATIARHRARPTYGLPTAAAIERGRKIPPVARSA